MTFTTMRTAPMGATGLTVPVQGLGCMRMRDSDDPTRGSDAFAVINRALDLGVTLLDTADMYGSGANEELVGLALRHRRDEAVLCTKFGVVWGSDGTWSTRTDAAYARAACDASLHRLGTDVIDLYYLHHRDDEVPIEETVGAMAELVAAGKVRHLGLSNVTADDVRAAQAVHPIAALQSEWSIVNRDVEAILPVCVELGVGVVPYCPQGAGRLARADERTSSKPGAADPDYVTVLRRVAHGHSVRPGQVALAWVQQRADVWGLPVTPIPGTTRVDHLEENVAALDVILTAEDLARIDALA